VNYATWKLNFTNLDYGTGPEEKISELGFSAQGGWVAGEVENGGTILGFVSGLVDESELAIWQFTYITEAEALAFCLAINPEAYQLDDGRITIPFVELTR
jgi:hypothetical protein